MKTTILLFVFVLFSVSFLHAQIEKGRVQIGGDIGLAHEDDAPNSLNPQYNYTSVNAAPSIGRFYSKNKLAGFILNFNYNKSISSTYLMRQFGGGIFFRQYQPVFSKLYILFHEQAGYFYQNGTDFYGSVHGQGVNLSCNAGMAYDVTKKIQLEVLINNLLNAGYTKTNRKETYNVTTSLEGNGFYGASLGFRFYL